MRDWKLLSIRVGLAVVGVGVGHFVSSRGTVEKPIDPGRDLEPASEVNVKTVWEPSADESPRSARDRRLLQAVEADYENVEALLAELEMPEDIDQAHKLLLGLAKQDGRLALQLFEDLNVPETYARNTGANARHLHSSANLRGRLFAVWAKRDADAASTYLSEWASSQPEWSPERRSAVKQVVGQLMKTDLERARGLAAESGLEEWFDSQSDLTTLDEKLEQFRGREKSDSRALTRMLQRESRRDIDATYDALLALPRDVNVEDGFGWLGSSFSGERLVVIRRHFSPESEVEDWSEVPLERKRWNGSGVQDWGMKDRQGALAWVEKLPEGEREHFRGEVLIGAAMDDPRWALEQMETLPDGKREEAQIAMAPEWSDRDPQAAREWVDSISDEALREKIQEAIDTHPSRW